MRNPRVVLAAVALAVAVAAGAAVLGLGGGGESDEPRRTVRAELTLARSVQPDTGEPELLVSLPEKRLNQADTTGGETSVLLRCVDQAGTVRIRRPTAWPLQEELGYPLPHIHQPASSKVLEAIRACRLTGSGIDFAGRVPGRLPRAAQ